MYFHLVTQDFELQNRTQIEDLLPQHASERHLKILHHDFCCEVSLVYELFDYSTLFK